MAMPDWITAAGAVTELHALPAGEARRLLFEIARGGHLPARAALFRVERSWTTFSLTPWAVDGEEAGEPPAGLPQPQSTMVEARNVDLAPDFFTGFERATTFGGCQGWSDWKKSIFTKLEADPNTFGGSITTTAVGLQFDKGVLSTLRQVRAKGKRGPPSQNDWEGAAVMLLHKALLDADAFYGKTDDDLVEWVQEWAQKQTGEHPQPTAIKNKLRQWQVNSTARSLRLKSKL